MSDNNKIKVMKKRGRPRKVQNVAPVPSLIDFSKVVKLDNLDIDPRMMKVMKTGLSIDGLFSHEGGIPAATNIMMIGDPGVGKTTVLLDVLAKAQSQGAKTLFISGEMGKKQMFKYTERFKQFGQLETLFMQDYLDYNTKDVIEQVLDRGYDLVLIDSAAEIIEGVRDDNNWDRKTAESWLVDVCIRNNKGENKTTMFTSFLLIQQVTKAGVFAGSNKLKHLVDAMGEMRREPESEGGSTYINFTKNRNGMVDEKVFYQLNNRSINYGTLEGRAI